MAPMIGRIQHHVGREKERERGKKGEQNHKNCFIPIKPAVVKSCDLNAQDVKVNRSKKKSSSLNIFFLYKEKTRSYLKPLTYNC